MSFLLVGGNCRDRGSGQSIKSISGKGLFPGSSAYKGFLLVQNAMYFGHAGAGVAIEQFVWDWLQALKTM